MLKSSLSMLGNIMKTQNQTNLMKLESKNKNETKSVIYDAIV